eukprot:TRINITY_DN3432_c0_g1_i4.p2 TRINITY_DN3432_c0_g1~~TRINITY_DN3432_c0_g1_i4.p2  ORF type:complete len:530 (-),score=215.37 TRINITY_DN3432_c0_g1_i4:16-1605(-)
MEEKQQELERLFLEIVEERAKNPEKTPKKGKNPRLKTASLLDLSLETALSSGEGYALLIRGRRELRDARDEIDGLRRGMDELEEASRASHTQLQAAHAALAAETLRAGDLATALAEAGTALKAARGEAGELAGEVEVLRRGGEPFERLTLLENRLKARDLELKSLKEELRSARGEIRTRDKAVERLAKEKGPSGTPPATPLRLRSELRILTQRLAALETESKVMERHFALRSKAMARESASLRRAASDADTALVVADLRNEVRLRDRAIRDLEEEKRTVERVAQRQTRALVNAGGGESDPFSGSAWSEERRVLLAELRSEKERREALEKEVKADNARVAKLSARVDQMAAVARRHARRGGASTGGGTGTIGGIGSPGGPATPHAAATATPGATDASATAGGGGDDDDAVPVALYDQLMRETLALRRTVAQKETALGERDAVIESLERKSGILDKARGVESRKGRQDAAAMATAIADLKLRLVERSEQFKERELQLRMLNLRLKNQLKAANGYIQEYVGTDTGSGLMAVA